MLTHHRLPVCLSWISTDLPLCSGIDTVATLYPRGQKSFHLLLTEPVIQELPCLLQPENAARINTPRLLWLEFSPYRATLTMQGNGQLSYRHFWEQGVYGLSRYSLHGTEPAPSRSLQLRNFTRNLTLSGNELPKALRIDYELWSDSVFTAERLQLGHYVFSLEIRH